MNFLIDNHFKNTLDLVFLLLLLLSWVENWVLASIDNMNDLRSTNNFNLFESYPDIEQYFTTNYLLLPFRYPFTFWTVELRVCLYAINCTIDHLFQNIWFSFCYRICFNSHFFFSFEVGRRTDREIFSVL